MKTTVQKSIHRIISDQEKKLREAIQRIVERARSLYSSTLEIVEESNDNGSADEFHIRSFREVLVFKKERHILFTASRHYDWNVYTCQVHDPAILDIVKEEMGKFCEWLGKDLEINITYPD